MQDAAGESDSGQKVYALSLFADWDDTIMQNAGAFAALYGYDPQGFVLLNVESGEKQSVLDTEGFYYLALHFLFSAKQQGLVDPDSPPCCRRSTGPGQRSGRTETARKPSIRSCARQGVWS